MDTGATFTPTGEIGPRHDVGGAETSIGMELGAELAYTAGRLSIEGRGRMLVAYEAEDYEESGASGAIRMTPGLGSRDLTLSVALEPDAPKQRLRQIHRVYTRTVGSQNVGALAQWVKRSISW